MTNNQHSSDSGLASTQANAAALSPADDVPQQDGMRTVQSMPTSAASKQLRTVDLLMLAVGTFTLGVDGFVLAGLLPHVASDLHVSISTAGQLTTLFALVYAVGSPVIAALTGSWDRKTLLAGGMAVFIVGIVLQALGQNFLTVAGA